jgi:hypothetical protein
MLPLGRQQELFSLDVSKLLIKAIALGYGIRFGEAERTVEQQKIYVQTGRSKTLDSQHLKKCAIDLHFTKDGVLCYPEELGLYWESLSDLNRWGGSWRGLIQSGKSNFKDLPHFERKF